MNLTNVFGINVEEQFLEWFNGEFATEFAERFPDKGMTLIVLDGDEPITIMENWETPLNFTLITAHLGDEEAAIAADGTEDNVVGKLRFCLRTMMDSAEAERRPDLVREGDFPHEGAGEYKGYYGGVSGLKKEEDWEIFCRCVDKLIELLAAVNSAAIAKADELREQEDCPRGTKYLNGISLAADKPDDANAA